MRHHVVVVGSYNTDLTIKTGRIPRPGETVIGGSFSRGGGGKGANQAVAAARAGAAVSFVARVGIDALGQEGMQRLAREQIDIRHVIQDPENPTGVAFIIVDERGENSIVVASGANGLLCPADIEKAGETIAAAGVLLVQLESPLDAVQSAIRLARRNGALVILNPAPAQPLNRELLRDVDVLTPNRVEAEMITQRTISDETSLRHVAQHILDEGVQHVLITLGKKGVYAASRERMELLPAYAVQTMDSTGAGDVFSGSLAAFLADGMTMAEALKMAIAASSLSVTRMGTQAAAPLRPEIDAFVAQTAPSRLEVPG